MKAKFIIFSIILITSALLGACSTEEATLPAVTGPEVSPEEEATTEIQSLTVMTHDSFEISEEALANFEDQEKIKGSDSLIFYK